ncbi:MAG: hypothetical protein U5L09_22270 [Bacteroidales bacterium]|nr:hypothetical protein [Bacteroidales bacterium]
MLDRFHEKGIKGGQNPDGTQKDGFLKYEKGRPVAGYDPDSDRYVAFEEFAAAEDKSLGALPDEWMPWKKLVKKSEQKPYAEQLFPCTEKNRYRGQHAGHKLRPEIERYRQAAGKAKSGP